MVFFLGGLRVNEHLAEIESMLSQFWDRHFYVDGNRPTDPQRCIPVYIHGDEGRGQCKRPIMIVSFQPLMSWGGCDNLNTSKILSFHFSIFSRFCFLISRNDGTAFAIMQPPSHLLFVHHKLRNTFTTRLLFTAIPSENYAPKGGTLQHLLQALVDDLNQLYHDGIEAFE